MYTPTDMTEQACAVAKLSGAGCVISIEEAAPLA
jgi:hypothetical protein